MAHMNANGSAITACGMLCHGVDTVQNAKSISYQTVPDATVLLPKAAVQAIT